MKNSKRRSIKKSQFTENRLDKIQDFKRRRKLGNIGCPSKRKKGKSIVKSWFNRTLNFLYNKGFWKTSHNEEFSKVLLVPEDCSITRNFDAVMKFFSNLLEWGLDLRVNDIEIDHTSCKNLGMSASSIMDELVNLIIKYHNFMHKPIHFHGQMPTHSSVSDMLIISGLVKRLHAQHNGELSSTVIPLALMKNVTADVGQTKVIHFLNKCLGQQQMKLTRIGIQNIAHMLGEIIDNCEIHSGQIKNYSIIGHYRYIPEAECGECSISIYNFGETIFENFLEVPTDSKIISEFDELTKKHIGFFRQKWTKETLWTLYALQDGVSSVYYNSESSNNKDTGRGTGTITFLSIFSGFKSNCQDLKPCMCISSGHTQIIVDGTYEIKYNNNHRLIIAFNEENNLEVQPDKDFVYSNELFFPGTIISIKFYIDHKYYESVLNIKGNGKNDDETVYN